MKVLRKVVQTYIFSTVMEKCLAILNILNLWNQLWNDWFWVGPSFTFRITINISRNTLNSLSLVFYFFPKATEIKKKFFPGWYCLDKISNFDLPANFNKCHVTFLFSWSWVLYSLIWPMKCYNPKKRISNVLNNLNLVFDSSSKFMFCSMDLHGHESV